MKIKKRREKKIVKKLICLWNVFINEMFYLWNVLFMKCPLYIFFALSVCLFVFFLYPIDVKTTEPIWPNFFVGPRVTQGKVHGWSNFHKFASNKVCFLKTLKIQETFFYKIRKIFFVFVLQCIQRENLFTVRVSTGIPGYGLSTEMIRKFFPFPLWKRFRKTGIPERFFFRKTEISGTLFRNYGSLRNSGTFRKFPEQLVP